MTAIVKRFQAELGLWPWEWRSLHVDEWLEDLASPPKRRAVSTLRGYQATLRGFLEYLKRWTRQAGGDWTRYAANRPPAP